MLKIRLRTSGMQQSALNNRASSSGSTALRVLLTREEGKNVKLAAALAVHGFECIEMPLIRHSVGADRPALPTVLRDQAFDWVVITSPEAAAVFLEGWQEAGCPAVRIAVVGGGTGEILQQSGITPAYVSSKATGKTLGGELPRLAGGTDAVLYPASSSASRVLQNSLADSGFSVTRLNTYDTSSVADVSPSQMQQAQDAEIVTFGSPSAVKSWLALVGPELASRKQYACIGSTSFKACTAAGLQQVHFPESPGVDGWVDSVLKAREQLA
ncbi:MAG: hypothetical protein WDW38_011551 [Sanguina aurantia]